MDKRAFLHTKPLALGLLAALAIAGAVRAQDAAAKDKVGAFKKELTKKGFLWNDGSVTYPPIVTWCCQCELPTCYGNNASTQYGFFALPPAPNQSPSVPNPYTEWYSEDHHLPQGWDFMWRLRPDEAVVFLGRTPPKVEYFGFTAYIYDRYVKDLHVPDCSYGNSQTRTTPSSAQSRFPVFASLGDTVNQVTIKLAGGNQDPYQKNAVIVMASDANVEKKVRKALIAADYPEESINFLALAPSLVKMGLDSEDDSFTIAMRVSPGPGNNVDWYYDQVQTLIRVTPATPVPPAKLAPVPPPKLRVRGTGKTEGWLLSEVEALGQAILAYYSGMGYTGTPVKMATIPDGYNCLENMQNCLGDNRDTVFICPAYDVIKGEILPEQPPLTMADGEFLVCYGVQHPSVKKATYSNISIMGWAHKDAPLVVTDQDMAGSAQEYLPGANPALYAYQIARKNGCLTQHCKELGTDCTSGIATDEVVAPVFRAYVEPATKVGPAWGEVILDRIIKFTPSH